MSDKAVLILTFIIVSTPVCCWIINIEMVAVIGGEALKEYIYFL